MTRIDYGEAVSNTLWEKYQVEFDKKTINFLAEACYLERELIPIVCLIAHHSMPPYTEYDRANQQLAKHLASDRDHVAHALAKKVDSLDSLGDILTAALWLREAASMPTAITTAINILTIRHFKPERETNKPLEYPCYVVGKKHLTLKPITTELLGIDEARTQHREFNPTSRFIGQVMTAK